MNTMVMGDDTSKECFGLPHGGAIAGIVFGILIILLGLSSLLGWEINLIAFIMILSGTPIVAGAIYTLTRERR